MIRHNQDRLPISVYIAYSYAIRDIASGKSYLRCKGTSCNTAAAAGISEYRNSVGVLINNSQVGLPISVYITYSYIRWTTAGGKGNLRRKGTCCNTADA